MQVDTLDEGLGLPHLRDPQAQILHPCAFYSRRLSWAMMMETVSCWLLYRLFRRGHIGLNIELKKYERGHHWLNQLEYVRRVHHLGTELHNGDYVHSIDNTRKCNEICPSSKCCIIVSHWDIRWCLCCKVLLMCDLFSFWYKFHNITFCFGHMYMISQEIHAFKQNFSAVILVKYIDVRRMLVPV